MVEGRPLSTDGEWTHVSAPTAVDDDTSDETAMLQVLLGVDADAAGRDAGPSAQPSAFLQAWDSDLCAHLARSAESEEALGNFSKAVFGMRTLLDERLRDLRSKQAFESDADLARRLQAELEREDSRRQAERQAEDARLLQEFLDRDTTCQLCGAKDASASSDATMHTVVALEHCEHRVCAACTAAEVARSQPVRQADYVCPVPGCVQPLSQRAVKRLLSGPAFEQYVDLELANLSVSDKGGAGGALVKCPAGCGWAVLIDAQSPSGTPSGKRCPQWESSLGVDGKPLSEDAARHRQTFRFRCRKCPDTEFCAKCLATPYHLGFTCEGFASYQAARKCRFCDKQVSVKSPALMKPEYARKNKALQKVLVARCLPVAPKAPLSVLEQMVAESEPLANLCDTAECQGRARDGCSHVLPCGHVCIGMRNESTHIGCLQPGCRKIPSGTAGVAAGARGGGGSMSSLEVGDGQAADDLCNICWVEELRQAPCVRLECGHVFHYHCIKTKLDARWAGARVTFSFLECPLCKQEMKAEAIEHLMRDSLALKRAVCAKAEQRLALEGGHKDAKELKPGGRYENRTGEYAMHKFAYYICFKCQSPYFGGQRSCEVAAGVGEEGRQFVKEEMICGGCSSMGQNLCPALWMYAFLLCVCV